MSVEQALARAVEVLARPGAVVLYPTETLYGLGGRAEDTASAERIATLKGRSAGRLLVLALDPPLTTEVARRLARAFWPGPLSLVIPTWSGIAAGVGGPDGFVGVRPPVHPVARRLVEAVGPLTSTSANRTGEAPVLRPSDLAFPVDAVIDVGLLPPSAPSTVVHGATGEILREGAIPREAIEAVLRGLVVARAP